MMRELSGNQGSNNVSRGQESGEGQEGEGKEEEGKAGWKSRRGSLRANQIAGTPYGASIDKELERLLVDYLSSD